MCANFDVQLWKWFLVMNSYSTLQLCMKFAYIVTGLVFLVSYWILDNVSCKWAILSPKVTVIIKPSVVLMKAGLCSKRSRFFPVQGISFNGCGLHLLLEQLFPVCSLFVPCSTLWRIAVGVSCIHSLHILLVPFYFLEYLM